MGENHFASLPVVLYGVVLLMAAIAWEIQRHVLVHDHAPDSAIAKAISRHRKE